MSTSMSVVLPQQALSRTPSTADEPYTKFPTLYLLHGLTDDHTMLLRRTSIERYVVPLGLAVIIPQVHRSFYTDEAHGNQYWTFLSEELPKVASRFFHLSSRREDTFVAGLSMGGYGAIKWALRAPYRFAAAASVSGVLGLTARLERKETDWFDRRLWDTIFDLQPIAGTPNDVLWLLDEVKKKGPDLPALHISCGTKDELYDENLRFEAEARHRGIQVTADFSPGGHTWDYWDAKIRDVVEWLPIHQPTVTLTEH